LLTPGRPRSICRRSFFQICARIGAGAMVGSILPSPSLTANRRESVSEVAKLVVTRRKWLAMGTLMDVSVADLPRSDALEAIRRARARVEILEDALTVFRADSPLPQLHRTPADRWLSVTAETVETLQTAAAGSIATGGDFDPTVGPLMRTWRREGPNRGLPDHELLRNWRARAGISALEIDVAGRRIRRLDDRLELDLGGIGKGVAIDAALAELASAGSSAALVNFGGSLGASGPPPERPLGWPIGIRHPRIPGDVCAVLDLEAGHLATSGDYERYRVADGFARHHILDPDSGQSTSGIAAVTVFSQTSTAADIESTAALVALARGADSPTPHFLALIAENARDLRYEGPLLDELNGQASSL